jgi:hypothetical protein
MQCQYCYRLSFNSYLTLAEMIPPNAPDGDQPITATYNGLTTQPGALITVQH